MGKGALKACARLVRDYFSGRHRAHFPKETIYIVADPMSDSLLAEKGIRKYAGELERRN